MTSNELSQAASCSLFLPQRMQNVNPNQKPLNCRRSQRVSATKLMGTHGEVYHERQRLQFCLLHTLNNLFQKEEFTRSSLDSIAEKLVSDDPDRHSWTPLSIVFRPHHNSLTGYYDVNVLIAALEAKGKTVIWHDKRNGASSIDLDHKLFGIVLNVHVRRYAGLWKSRHWLALREIDGVWYNLDSDLRKPMAFVNADEVRRFLDYMIGQGGEVLLLMEKTD